MSTRLLANIQNQPAAWTVVLEGLTARRETLKRVAQVLESSKRVVLSGMGASFFASLSFSYRLNRCMAIDSSDLLYFRRSEIDADTTLVLVSRSGESVEVTKLVEIARDRGSRIIGITNVADSSLFQKSDICITMECPADEMVAIQTYTATVSLFALLDAEMRGQFSSAAEELTAATASIREWLPDCIAARLTWDRLLSSEQPIYLLGRGEALGSVAEGVLLMHETAKSPMVGMPVAQFRHGPVEAVDDSFRAIILGTQPTTRELDAALLDDLKKMGARAHWIGSDCADSLCAWPANVAERFTGLAEVIPLQLLAYRKAELRGIEPGKFRWAPLVTATETGFAL